MSSDLTTDLPAEVPSRTARRGYDRDEVDRFVDATRSRLAAIADRLGQQQAEVERLETENRSYSRSIDIAMKAAGDVMEEATAAAESPIGEAAERAASLRATAEEQATAIVAAAEARAQEVEADAEAVAAEVVTVGRADAVAAVHDERSRIAAELEMVEALQSKLAKERQALVALQDRLAAQLDEAGRYLVAIADDPLRSGQEILALMAAPTADPVDEQVRAEDDPAPVVGAAAAETDAGGGADGDEGAEQDGPAGEDIDADHGLDTDHEFFSTEVEEEPSRRWILG